MPHKPMEEMTEAEKKKLADELLAECKAHGAIGVTVGYEVDGKGNPKPKN